MKLLAVCALELLAERPGLVPREIAHKLDCEIGQITGVLDELWIDARVDRWWQPSERSYAYAATPEY